MIDAGMNNFCKKTVKNRFKKSLSTYKENALVQREMAFKLVDKLVELFGIRFDNIFEIGTGSGILTKELVQRINHKKYYCNDIVEQSKFVIEDIINDFTFIEGDIEQVEFPTELDLIISNATFQWVYDLRNLVKTSHFNLKNSGIVAFTTFGKQNLCEIKQITGQSLKYYDLEELKALLNNDFEILCAESEIVKLSFNKPVEVLRHLKYSGVNALNQKTWTKSDLNKFIDGYNSLFREDEKLQLSYNPLFFVLRKK